MDVDLWVSPLLPEGLCRLLAVVVATRCPAMWPDSGESPLTDNQGNHRSFSWNQRESRWVSFHLQIIRSTNELHLALFFFFQISIIFFKLITESVGNSRGHRVVWVSVNSVSSRRRSSGGATKELRSWRVEEPKSLPEKGWAVFDTRGNPQCAWTSTWRGHARKHIHTRNTSGESDMTFKIKRPRVDIRFQNKVQEIAVNRKELIYVFAQWTLLE